MMTEDEHGQLKALAWRTLKAVDHIDAKAADEGLTISPEWRDWRSQVRAVIRGERLDIPNEPARYLSEYEAHWNATTSGTLGEARDAEVYVDPLVAENDALRARIAELEAALSAPVLELSSPTEPPAEALLEAYPDEDHAALKARILSEFASLRNMLIGQIPMSHEQLDRLVALEHPKYQSWLQGVTQ